MSQQDVELVRRFELMLIAAVSEETIAQEDWVAGFAHFAEDAEWHTSGVGLMPQTVFRGREAIRASWERPTIAQGAELEDVLDFRDVVVSVVREWRTIAGTDTRVEQTTGTLYTLRDHTIVRVEHFWKAEDALAAARSRALD